MTQVRQEQIPPYGWDVRQLIDGALVSDVDLVTDSFERLPGLFKLNVMVTLRAGHVFGGNFLNVILEGSNTGDPVNSNDWFLIADLPESNYFDGGVSITKTLGLAGSVNIGRFQHLRVRLEEIGGAVTFEADVYVSGTAGNGQKLLRLVPINSVSGGPKEFVTDYVQRPAGTRWLTATAKAYAMILEPPLADGVSIYLDAASTIEDAQAGRFVQFAGGGEDPSVASLMAVGESCQFPFGNAPSVDMAQYNYFRFRVENPFPLDLISSYTIEATLVFDDNDWAQGEIGETELSDQLQQLFLRIMLSQADPQIGDTRSVSGQFVDLNGVPVRNRQNRAFLVLSDLNFAGQASLHPTATASGSEASAVTNSNFYPIQSDDEGKFTVVVDSNGVPTTAYLSFISYSIGNDASGSSVLALVNQVTVVLA